MPAFIIIVIISVLCIGTVKLTGKKIEKNQDVSSGYPPAGWTWTPVPDEQLAEIIQKDPEEKPADLNVYGIDNNRVIAMSQRACVEYLSEDNDFNGVIMIADADNHACQEVMKTYVDVAEEESDVNFYYVDLRTDDYKEAIRTVLASTLPKDKTGKPILKTPLVLAVHGDQVVDYQEGIPDNSDTDQSDDLTDSEKSDLKKRYVRLASESINDNR